MRAIWQGGSSNDRRALHHGMKQRHVLRKRKLDRQFE
jgi:hypothetical protein